jgi:putative Holliday junction resolvase
MKIIGLDVGDQWTGIAISDALGMFARPYRTEPSSNLETALATILQEERIGKIVIGYPKTMRGTVSEQTKKVDAVRERLQELFPSVTIVSWDERLSSKRADSIKQAKTKEDKIKSHSIAAAFILSSYLDFVRFNAPPQSDL